VPFAGDNKREKIVVLLTMCFALFMAMLDNTVVNVALPKLSEKLGAGVSGLQWIVDGYVLAFASLLLTGGILGDRYGRKRMFLLGLTGFTLFSLACGLSRTTGQLIGFRAFQGIGGALLMPGTLSIITVTFPPQERAQAIGIWAGVSGIALGLGPTLGGYIIEHVGWQSIFFLNVPIGIIGLIIGSRSIRESRADQARRLDIAGLALGTSGLFAVVYGLIEANQLGWASPAIIGSLIVGTVLLALFVRYESRARHPMMPLSFYRIPAFSAGNAVAYSVSLGMFGTFFFLSLYMQLIRGYSPFSAGVRFLPMTAAIIVAAPNAGRLASKYGSRWPMVCGTALAGTGLFLVSRMSATTPFWILALVFLMMGIGMGSTMTPMTAAVMNAVGHQRAGLGSAATNTSREVGGVFGIALLGTLLTTKLSSTFGPGLARLGLSRSQFAAVADAAHHGTLSTDLVAGLHLTPSQSAGVFRVFSSSFMSGFHVALLVAAVMLFAATFVSFRWIPAEAPKAEHVGELPPEPVLAH
jgi:EmrB/QacA subfamily drug resistance transporter